MYSCRCFEACACFAYTFPSGVMTQIEPALPLMPKRAFGRLFLAVGAVVESSRLLKMPGSDFTGDIVCGGIRAPAVCLQAS